MNDNDMNAWIAEAVAQQADILKDLARKIHAHPELGFEERQACAWQTALLKRWSFDVRTPWLDMETAYCADFGEGKPVFCLMAEYDALPEIGHGCGHNLIAAAALGAAYAASRALARAKVAGRIRAMGTPAEESKGGKVKIVARGGMKGVDAAMMAHPSWRTVPDTGSTAIRRFRVAFRGQSAHAAASPEQGRNALDAVTVLFHGIGAWRQQLPESARIHGVVQEGGVLPNIIPDRTRCEFYLRSPDDKVLDAMTDRFKRMVRAAALMTDTEAAIEQWLTPYKARWPNATLNRLYVEAAEQLGMAPEQPEHPGRGSSDFGDVSQKAPAAHVYFGIARQPTPAHSPQFAKAAASAYGTSQMLKAAEALARTAVRFLTNAQIRRAARDNYRAEKRSRS